MGDRYDMKKKSLLSTEHPSIYLWTCAVLEKLLDVYGSFLSWRKTI